MNPKSASQFKFKRKSKSSTGIIALAIYIIAGFFSLRAFATEQTVYHISPALLAEIINTPEKKSITKLTALPTVKIDRPAPIPKILKSTAPKTLSTLNESEKIMQKNMEEKVASQVSKLMSAQASLQPESSPPEAEVAHCTNGECNNSSLIKEAKYEQCTSQNDYLESRLEKMDEKSPLFHFLSGHHPELKQVIQPNCVQAFMEAKGKGRAGGIYRACSAETDNTMNKASRPCISERYVNVTANSFNLVSSCLTDIPSHIKNVAAKIYPLESGFHVNAMNPMSHDAGSGIGQLTQGAIADVSRSLMARTKETLASSNNESCRAIESELLQDKNPMPSSASLSCDRLNVEKGNPLLNIVYSLSLLNIMQKSLDRNTFSDPEYIRKMDLPAHELAQVKEALLTWAYNAGQTVATPMKIVLDNYYSQKPVTDAKLFIKQVESAIYSYKLNKYMHSLRNKNPQSRARINSRYYSEVNKSFNLIDKNLEGGQCLLNP